MPEYCLTYQDQHLHDQYNTVRVWGQLFPPLFAAMAAAGALLYVTFSTRIGGFYLASEEGPFFNQLERTQKERLAAKRNFIGMSKENVKVYY